MSDPKAEETLRIRRLKKNAARKKREAEKLALEEACKTLGISVSSVPYSEVEAILIKAAVKRRDVADTHATTSPHTKARRLKTRMAIWRSEQPEESDNFFD